MDKSQENSIKNKKRKLLLSGMDIPESVNTQEKAQENSRIMAGTPVPFLIMSLSVSTVLTMLIGTTYNIVDTYFVSELGNGAVAAVGLVFPVMALIQSVGYTFGMGAGSKISRLMGRQRRDEAEQILATAVTGGIASGVVIAIVFMIFRTSIIRMLGATDSCTMFALEYGTYIMAAAPVMCGAYVLNNALRAEGQPYMALLAIAAGGATNALLDYIIVVRLQGGVKGAGIATLAGQTVSFVIMCLFLKSGRSVISIRLSYMKRLYGFAGILKTGLPSFFRQGLMCFAAVMISRSCRQYGDSALAGITVANKIFAVVFAVLVGYGQGFAPVAGYAKGAGLKDRVRKSLRYTMITSLVFMTAVGIVSYVWADKLTAIFIDSDIAAFSLKAHALSMPFAAVCLVTGMYYQAVGMYVKAAFISVMRQGIFFIPLIFILPSLYGIYGVAWVQAAADILSGAASLVFYLLSTPYTKAK